MESAIRTLQKKIKDLEMFAAPSGAKNYIDKVINEHKDAISIIRDKISMDIVLEKIKKLASESSDRVADEVKQIAEEFDQKPNEHFLNALNKLQFDKKS